MAKDEQINIRMTKQEKEQLEKDAKSQHRTVSNLLLWCWQEWRESKKSKGR